MKKLVVILPALNEARVIGSVLSNLKKELKRLKGLKTETVVVDDGSRDKTSKIARSKGAIVFRHPINRGLGGALATGIEHVKQNQVDLVVTFDADGQHDPKDINKVLRPILENKADVVIGTRNIKKMPFDRKIITLISSWITFIFFGVYCSDTQSGFRAFNKKALNRIRIKTQRMEVSSEIFHEIRKYKFRLKEVPIKVIYTSYSRKKGQENLNALKILLKLTLRLFR